MYVYVCTVLYGSIWRRGGRCRRVAQGEGAGAATMESYGQGSSPLVIDAEAYAHPGSNAGVQGGGGAGADLAGLSPTPLTPSAGASSMCVRHRSHRPRG